VVQLVSTLGSAVISARAELGSIIASALPEATVLTCQQTGGWEWVCVSHRVGLLQAGGARDSGRASLGCGLLSVRSREATNRVTIDCWYQTPVGFIG
jgi:hypothetical protein